MTAPTFSPISPVPFGGDVWIKIPRLTPKTKRPTNSRAIRRRWARFRAGDVSAWPWELRSAGGSWGGYIHNLGAPK